MAKSIEIIDQHALYFFQLDFSQPVAKVFPKNHDQIQKMVTYANKYGFAIRTASSTKSLNKPIW